MTAVNVYLTFNGNCEEAFNFYKSVFGGEFSYVGRFKDAPQEGGEAFSGANGENIMHIGLPISKETALMGCDSPDRYGKVTFGNNFSISINTDSTDNADKLFAGLSKGGQALMPMTKTFWGSYFGMLVDKYGISWMVSFDQNQMQQKDSKEKTSTVA